MVAQLSISDWKNLYNAALEFKKIKCWEWMLDSDIFGVQDPVSNDIGYCCIMGNLGEHFALGIYLGTDGLETYLKIQRGEVTEGSFETLTSQKCLMVSFEDRDMLSPEDREIIKNLKLQFRGRNEWPLFRSYYPGYYPWYLNKEEVNLMIPVIKQTIEIALRFQDDPDMLTPPKEDHYLVRVPKKANGGWKWEDKWLKPGPLDKSKASAPHINEVRLQKIKKSVKHGAGSWQADFFFSPTPVREAKERPYYPYAVLYIDSNSGLILHVDMLRPDEHIDGFPNSLMNLIERSGVSPHEILVRKEEAYELLKLIAERLNIQLRLVKRLETLEYIQASMFQFFK